MQDVEAVRHTAKRALQAQETSLEHSTMSATKLAGLKQVPYMCIVFYIVLMYSVCMCIIFILYYTYVYFTL